MVTVASSSVSVESGSSLGCPAGVALPPNIIRPVLPVLTARGAVMTESTERLLSAIAVDCAGVRPRVGLTAAVTVSDSTWLG